MNVKNAVICRQCTGVVLMPGSCRQLTVRNTGKEISATEKGRVGGNRTTTVMHKFTQKPV